MSKLARLKLESALATVTAGKLSSMYKLEERMEEVKRIEHNISLQEEEEEKIKQKILDLKE